jgi:hypothetical protein
MSNPEKKLKTSVALSPANVKWMRSRHLNVSDFVDAVITECREKEESARPAKEEPAKEKEGAGNQ